MLTDFLSSSLICREILWYCNDGTTRTMSKIKWETYPLDFLFRQLPNVRAPVP